MKADKGDFIILGVNGEVYPCKPDIFEKTYEEVGAFTDAYVDRCSNVHYTVEYEILLVADDDFRKYITVEYESEGMFSSVFFDQVEQIEDMFEEWFEEHTHGFGENEDGDKFITFYDNTGENVDIDVCSVREALSMITSIRVIKCDRKIIEN